MVDTQEKRWPLCYCEGAWEQRKKSVNKYIYSATTTSTSDSKLWFISPFSPRNALAAAQTGSIHPSRHPHYICQADQPELLWTAWWQTEVQWRVQCRSRRHIYGISDPEVWPFPAEKLSWYCGKLMVNIFAFFMRLWLHHHIMHQYWLELRKLSIHNPSIIPPLVVSSLVKTVPCVPFSH